MKTAMKVYELSFQKNIRDIGGMVTKDGRHIKYGRLIRGSVLTKIDENGKFHFAGDCLMCTRCSFGCPTDAFSIGILNSWRVSHSFHPFALI